MRNHLIRSTVLAAGVGTWQALVHAIAFGAPEAASFPHVLRDSTLLWPLSLVAVIGGHRFARRFARQDGVVAGLMSAIVLSLLLVPSVGVHGWIDHRLAGMHAHSEPVAELGLGLFGVLTHGVRDALVGLIAAVPVALVMTRTPLRRAPGNNRRPNVASAAAGVAAVVLATLPSAAAAKPAMKPFSQKLPIPRVLTGSDLKITMKQADVQILPGRKTRMWTYDGIFPGPTIRRPSGRTTRVTFVNALPREAGATSVHLHGAHSAASEDGHPHHNTIPVGGRRTYTYRFWENGAPERAATHWYHDHAMDRTGRNVWMGLAGMQILDDAFDAALPLPKGEFDVPLMLTDRTFDANNQLVVPTPTRVAAGERVLVNGAVQPYFEVAARTYRFRVVNASNLVEYRIGLSNGAHLIHVASEAGLLPAPVRRSSIVVGPGERAEVVVDFAGMLGRDVVLVNSANRAGPAFMRGTPMENGVPATRDLLKFKVRRTAMDRSSVPPRLRPVPDFGAPSVTRHFTFDSIPVAAMAHGSGEIDPAVQPMSNVFGSMLWTINGLPYDPARIDARPVLGTTERWVFTNTSPTRHNVHIHDVDWKIVSRRGGATVFNDADPDVALGESGLKETFLLSAGETVEVVSKFTDHLGVYLFHCHILPHEDAAMMAQFEVVPAAAIS